MGYPKMQSLVAHASSSLLAACFAAVLAACGGMIAGDESTDSAGKDEGICAIMGGLKPSSLRAAHVSWTEAGHTLFTIGDSFSGALESMEELNYARDAVTIRMKWSAKTRRHETLVYLRNDGRTWWVAEIRTANHSRAAVPAPPWNSYTQQGPLFRTRLEETSERGCFVLDSDDGQAQLVLADVRISVEFAK